MLLQFNNHQPTRHRNSAAQYKRHNIRRNNLRMTLSRDCATRRPTGHTTAQPTCNGILETHFTNAPTTNALRIQQFSSQRQPGEFSRVESPTQQSEVPVYPDASVSSLDHSAGIISAEMIVMVVQPHPAGGMLARWHCMPGGAGLLPADVPPYSRGIIINSLVAYPMGAGRTRIAPGKQAGKNGGRTDVEKRYGYLASARLLVDILFHNFPVGNTEIGRAKNWKGHGVSRRTR
jgi:hypothetical protein